MNTPFDDLPRVRFAGPQTDNPFAFRYYDPERKVLDRRMADWLRPAVAYWHSFCGTGADPFGAASLDYPWHRAADGIAAAEAKAAAAFAFMERLGFPFFCFHDRDVAPEGATLAESNRNLSDMVDTLGRHMERTGVKLLWGTANLFSHPRYMAGAATNPDPDVFAYAAAQVKEALEATHRLGGANYVLWGGREGYDSLLNTDLKREGEQAGRFFAMVVEHKHRIGFKGTILIEPKPMEPTKHQYDRDVATVYAFLRRFDLAGEVMLNIEANHATLAGHDFAHEIALAASLGVLGSIDINRGDPRTGWDTDQFAQYEPDLVLALLEVVRAGGLGNGGFNFDAKVRRQSIAPDDLLHGHIGGVDALARALLAAACIHEDGLLDRARAERYDGWRQPAGERIRAGKETLASLSARVLAESLEPCPRTGGQERLENILARYL
jgi:xylose isomerase